MASKKEAVEESPKCPITRAEFSEGAKPLLVVIDGKQLIADVKQFESGSIGWYAGEKVIVTINGVPCKAQVGLNITLVGSKDLPK